MYMECHKKNTYYYLILEDNFGSSMFGYTTSIIFSFETKKISRKNCNHLDFVSTSCWAITKVFFSLNSILDFISRISCFKSIVCIFNWSRSSLRTCTFSERLFRSTSARKTLSVQAHVLSLLEVNFLCWASLRHRFSSAISRKMLKFCWRYISHLQLFFFSN